MTRIAALALATALIGSLALAAPAFAASGPTSGSVNLKGEVQLDCYLRVEDAGASLNLVQGETKKVGEVTETCNAGTGYTVSLSSANAGKLKAASGNATVDYTVNYGGTPGALGSQLQVGRQNAEFGKKSDLNVTVPTNAKAVAGNYSDTITITIAAK